MGLEIVSRFAGQIGRIGESRPGSRERNPGKCGFPPFGFDPLRVASVSNEVVSRTLAAMQRDFIFKQTMIVPTF